MRIKEKVCSNCLQTFKPTSRHRLCPKCRNSLCRKECQNCGRPIQCKSKYCVLCSNKLEPRNTSPLKIRAANHALNKARSRHHVVDITADYLIELLEHQQSRCAYTGLPMYLPTSTKSCEDKRLCASLDRIDSTLPYTKGNVQWVVVPINLMKNTMSDQDTREFISWLKNS
jgi:hypothetical protein